MSDINPWDPPITARHPRFAGPPTFGLLPRIDEVEAQRPDEKIDVKILGVPFDAGVSYRPGARFGPYHIRTSSKLLRPYNQATNVRAFHSQQVADCGNLGVNPFDIPKTRSPKSNADADQMRADGAKLLTLDGDHTLALPNLRSLHKTHGTIAVLHFDAHLDTWDTYIGAPYTHCTPFRRASEEGLLDLECCIHVGISGPLYGQKDVEDDAVLGFQMIRSDDYQFHLRPGCCGRVCGNDSVTHPSTCPSTSTSSTRGGTRHGHA